MQCLFQNIFFILFYWYCIVKKVVHQGISFSFLTFLIQEEESSFLSKCVILQMKACNLFEENLEAVGFLIALPNSYFYTHVSHLELKNVMSALVAFSKFLGSVFFIQLIPKQLLKYLTSTCNVIAVHKLTESF